MKKKYISKTFLSTEIPICDIILDDSITRAHSTNSSILSNISPSQTSLSKWWRKYFLSTISMYAQRSLQFQEGTILNDESNKINLNAVNYFASNHVGWIVMNSRYGPKVWKCAYLCIRCARRHHKLNRFVFMFNALPVTTTHNTFSFQYKGNGKGAWCL